MIFTDETADSRDTSPLPQNTLLSRFTHDVTVHRRQNGDLQNGELQNGDLILAINRNLSQKAQKCLSERQLSDVDI